MFMALLLLVTPTTALFTAIFYNNCNYPIDVEFTSHKANCGRKTVPAGGTANHPCEPQPCPENVSDNPDCGGATMLFHKNGQKLATEYGNRVEKGVRKMWYNWSNDDGNPFLGESRNLLAGGGCRDLICAKGSDACDWKTAGIMSCSPDPYYIAAHIC